MALFDACALDPPTLEEEPKCTAGNDVNELYWNICNQIDTKPQSPSQFSHHDMGETLLPSLDLSDFGDMSVDLKECWKHLDTAPLENSEVLEAQFPANLPPLPLHSTPHPSDPPHTPNKSVPQPPTSVPAPTSPSSRTCPSPPGSSQTVHICPKLNVIVRSLKKEEPVRKAKTKKKVPRCKKQINLVPSSTVPSTQNQQMHFVGWLNGQQLYKIEEDNRESDSEDSQVYIKKPPNAFMLFMKEQRPNVSKELWRKGSGAVNSYLAAIWRSMSKEQRSTYFNDAELLSALHKKKYPNWSNQVNYGKKRRRDKRQTGVTSLESNFVKFEPRQPTQVMQAPHAQPIMMQPQLQHGAYIQDHHPQGPFLQYDLPQGPYMWNPHPQGPFIQNHLPQGPGMLNPHQPGPYVQNPHQKGPHMRNPNPQEAFVINSYPQGPYMPNSTPQGHFRTNYYSQGPYMQNPHPQVPAMNHPHPEGPYMNNPLPQRPMQSHHPEGFYMQGQQSQVECKPNQQLQMEFKPNQQQQMDFKPNQQLQMEFRPNQQQQMEFRPNQQQQMEFRPNQQQQIDFKPNQQPQMECMQNQQPQAYLPTLGCEKGGDYMGSTHNALGPPMSLHHNLQG